MNEKNVTARRYHWFSDTARNLVMEPHSGIISDGQNIGLNMTAKESGNTQKISTELVQGSYNTLMKDLGLLSNMRILKPAGARLYLAPEISRPAPTMRSRLQTCSCVLIENTPRRKVMSYLLGTTIKSSQK